VKADVIFAAKSAGVGQRSRGNQTPQVVPGFEFGGEAGTSLSAGVSA